MAYNSGFNDEDLRLTCQMGGVSILTGDVLARTPPFDVERTNLLPTNSSFRGGFDLIFSFLTVLASFRKDIMILLLLSGIINQGYHKNSGFRTWGHPSRLKAYNRKRSLE